MCLDSKTISTDPSGKVLKNACRENISEFP